ncbi:MAG TPA: DEAD/DEAH box helicase family protein [Acidimicrobiales bacterium]|nr:DEAD/DEAH box helicase family protein [Acidimicrobiales bacterium]
MYELVQNGADALVGQGSAPAGRIDVVLTNDCLYCANEGRPIDLEGVDAILTSHISMKRGTEIGRFGLGFKSVLGVSLQPAFFSKTGSFGFDAADAAERIRRVVPDAARMPTLRVARPLTPDVEASSDAVLAELMEWATTIVRLPRTVDDTAWLRDDLAAFPPEFLLFSPHVSTLRLDDRTTSKVREIRLRRSGKKHRLDDNSISTEWQVFSTLHHPSEAARKDAGELAERDSIPLIWAVPTEGKAARGKFWAFFPTEYFTTLSGILNAPWKTNEDRQNLLPGPFNEELLSVASELVVAAIPDLSTKKDPAKFLDGMPARGREAANWADQSIGERVYARAVTVPSLPDQRGTIVHPRRLRVHPSGLEHAWLDAWSEYPGRPVDWVHPSAETRERRPRVERLLGPASVPATLATWLEALVEDGSAAASIFALRLASRIARDDPRRLEEVREAKIVLTEDRKWSDATNGSVFLRSRHDPESSSHRFVHRTVARAAEAKDALAHLGVDRIDATGELEAFLNNVRTGRVDWEMFWDVSRRVGAVKTKLIVDRRASDLLATVKAKVASGRFRPLRDALLPGGVVVADGSRDFDVLIDASFHAEDLELLSLLGATDGPRAGGGSSTEPWFGKYRAAMMKDYYEGLPARSSRPLEDYLVIDAPPFPGPLGVIEELSVEGRALFTERVLQAARGAEAAPWRMHHATDRRYPERDLEPGWLWHLKQFGAVQTTQGPKPIEVALAPGTKSGVVAVALCSEEDAHVLGLPSDLALAPDAVFSDAVERVEASPTPTAAGELYGTLALVGRNLSEVVCRVGWEFDRRPPAEVTVVSSRRDLEALVQADTPVLLAPSSEIAALLVSAWGMQPVSTALQTELRAVPSTEPLPLVDEFPILRPLLGDRSGLVLQRCSTLEIQTSTTFGTTSQPRSSVLDGSVFYWLDSGDEQALLQALSDEVDLKLTPQEIRALFEQVEVQRERDLVVRIRGRVTDASRLVDALGVDRLRRRLPAGLLESAASQHGSTSDEEVAEMALAAFGVDVLKEFRNELTDAGLTPPLTWSGSRAAQKFVRDLGFPPEFAGFQQARRDPVLDVDGPVELPALHDFQRAIEQNTRSLLRRESHLRGLLSMPTGSGKTRVAVQAVVEEVRERTLSGPVLWIAQTDELCEQAVTTWAYVWRSDGPRSRLTISRLWAANGAVPAEEGAFQVVVATIDKLGVCSKDPGYDWLTECAAVVIDEAHTSTAPTYTSVLDWLGLGRQKQRCPLIGLTATPFRGTSESETRHLVRRYGQHRLDRGVLPEDPYADLQSRGILATVEHRVLEGAQVELTHGELDQLERTRRLPASVEERLGADQDRNRMLVDSIRQLPADWMVLLFAPSVANAQVLAALLRLEGLPAATISGETEPGARRHYIEEFRSGRLRVLTNYNVLTQGFDAPAVRAVYVARPTYSPNLYQQMIGRGLRGPLNGGKEQCLIVNVEDNIRQYGESLAFHDFEHLWNRQT